MPSDKRLAGPGTPELDDELLELELDEELLELDDELLEFDEELLELDEELLELEDELLLAPPDEPEPPQATSANDTATANPLLSRGEIGVIFESKGILVNLLVGTFRKTPLDLPQCSLLL